MPNNEPGILIYPPVGAHRLHRNLGFTLLELLVTIAVVGILVAVLIPAVGSVRESARKTDCMNRMRQLGMGLQVYESRTGSFPPAATGKNYDESIPRHNVLSFILPYLELDYISEHLDLNEHWDDEDNSTNTDITGQDIYLFLCPSAPYRDTNIKQGLGNLYKTPHAATDYCSAYQIAEELHPHYENYGYSGPRTALKEPLLQLNQNTSQAYITDGMSNTFMLFESAGKPYRYQNGSLFHTAYDSFTEWSNWKASFKINPGYQGYTCGKQRLINCTNIGEIYSFHPGGATFLYGDGGVKFESEEMAIPVFVNRFTRAGGEIEFRE